MIPWGIEPAIIRLSALTNCATACRPSSQDIRYFSGDQVKEDEMGWLCGTHPKYQYLQDFGYPLKKWLGWPQSQFDGFRRKEKFFLPVGMRTQDLPAP